MMISLFVMIRLITYRDECNPVAMLVMSFAELLEEGAVVLEVSGGEVHREELLPRPARHGHT